MFMAWGGGIGVSVLRHRPRPSNVLYLLRGPHPNVFPYPDRRFPAARRPVLPKPLWSNTHRCSGSKRQETPSELARQ